MSKGLKVLFTSSGRRVELIRIFKKEGFVVFSADADPTAPSLYIADKSFILPPLSQEENYLDSLIRICKEEGIDIVIPLIDPDVVILSKNKEVLRNFATVLVSDYTVVKVANDKYFTYEFFKKIGLNSPKTILLNKSGEIVHKEMFPALLKPRFGSASKGILECPDKDFFSFYSTKLSEDYVLQRSVFGE